MRRATFENKIVLAGLFALLSCAGPPKGSSSSSRGPTDSVAAVEPSACPKSVLAAGTQQGGACLEPAVLGAAVVAGCQRELESLGWTRDRDAETLIGTQTRKALVCFRASPDPER